MSFLFYDAQGNHTSIIITRWKTSEWDIGRCNEGLNDGMSDMESQLESPLFLLRKRKEGPDSQELAWCSQIVLSSPVNTNSFTEHQHQTLYDG